MFVNTMLNFICDNFVVIADKCQLEEMMLVSYTERCYHTISWELSGHTT